MNVEPKNLNSGNFHINLQSSHTCVLQMGFPLHISGFKLQRLMHVAWLAHFWSRFAGKYVLDM